MHPAADCYGSFMIEESAILTRVGEIPLWILKCDYDRPKFERGSATLPSLTPLGTIFDHHWGCGLEFALIDVGAKYGLSTILAANYIHGCGHEGPIIAFEPGAAAELIACNLALNHLDSRVVLELKAVSDRCGEAVIYSEPGHPEDNHLIRRNVDRHFDTKVVPIVSLDSYAELNRIAPPVVLKVDTQGAEWEVWLGMRRLVQAGPVTLMTEFTPWTFEGRSNPARFLGELAQHYYLVNMNPKNMAGSFQDTDAGFQLIPPQSFERFTRFIAASAFGWTDLLCIPRKLPNSRQLLDAILNV